MNLLQQSLAGGAAFRGTAELLRDLPWAEASQFPPGLPYTIADLTFHLAVTQRASLDLASGRADRWPEHLNVWPDAPLTEAEFEANMTDLRLGLSEAQMLASDPSSRARDILIDLAVHNAYHWGQIALLRRLRGTLPAPDPGQENA